MFQYFCQIAILLNHLSRRISGKKNFQRTSFTFLVECDQPRFQTGGHMTGLFPIIVDQLFLPLDIQA